MWHHHQGQAITTLPAADAERTPGNGRRYQTIVDNPLQITKGYVIYVA
jgi:hypothetical protein